MKSAEISKGTEAVRTPCSRDDSINSAGKRVFARITHTAAIAGVPGLRWNVSLVPSPASSRAFRQARRAAS